MKNVPYALLAVSLFLVATSVTFTNDVSTMLGQDDRTAQPGIVNGTISGGMRERATVAEPADRMYSRMRVARAEPVDASKDATADIAASSSLLVSTE